MPAGTRRTTRWLLVFGGCVLVVAIAAYAVTGPLRLPLKLPAKLVGSWRLRDGPVPGLLTFNADGTGLSASGVGHFRFRWAATAENVLRGELHFSVRYTGEYFGADKNRVLTGMFPPTPVRNYRMTFGGGDAAALSEQEPSGEYSPTETWDRILN